LQYADFDAATGVKLTEYYEVVCQNCGLTIGQVAATCSTAKPTIPNVATAVTPYVVPVPTLPVSLPIKL
jgi:hypothetical protein